MWAVELRRVWDAVEACRGLSGCVARRYKGDASFSGQAASTMRPGMARLCPGLYCTHKKGRHSLVHLRFDNRGMLVAMSREEKAARATGRARPALLSASMSYILARADAYDAIREDASFNAWVDMVGGVDGVCLRGSWLHGLNHPGSDRDLLVVGASVDDKARAVNIHAGGVDALCVTAGRFARLLASADQVCVEARDYGGVLWRDGAVGRALVEAVRVPLPLLVAHYRGQAARDRAALASGRGSVGRRVKLARNVARQEACADSLAERGVLPVVSWERVVDGVRALVDDGVVGAGVLAGVERMAGAFQ